VKIKQFWLLNVEIFLVLYIKIENRTNVIIVGCKKDFFLNYLKILLGCEETIESWTISTSTRQRQATHAAAAVYPVPIPALWAARRRKASSPRPSPSILPDRCACSSRRGPRAPYKRSTPTCAVGTGIGRLVRVTGRPSWDTGGLGWRTGPAAPQLSRVVMVLGWCHAGKGPWPSSTSPPRTSRPRPTTTKLIAHQLMRATGPGRLGWFPCSMGD